MNSVFYRAIIGGNIIFCFTSCSGLSAIDYCKIAIKNAKSVFNTYYRSKDSTLLNSSLRYTEQSMLCKETRLEAVELKTSLLVLLKQYKSGYEFIDSLQENDFIREYKKKMSSSIFRAFEYETNGDTTSAHKFYAEGVNCINHYIERTNNDNEPDQDAYYDLYFLKSKILPKEEIEKELEQLAKKYPTKRDFFKGLKLSFNDTQ